MKAAKFTPGPWESKEVPTQCGRAFRIGAGAMLEPGPKGCCIIYDDYGCGSNERKANAQLISAAPDLYEALRAILDADPDGLSGEHYTLGRAAIAKAEGRS